MDKTQVNQLACALLETLDNEGIPESYAVMVGQRLGLSWDESRHVLCLLVVLGLLERADGPRVIPGPKWAAAHAGLSSHRDVR